jgi:hypothetical protein
MATPLLTATPGEPPTYNPSMADTFSWVPVQGAGRPLFARTTYIANPEDISISLSANNLVVNADEVEGLLRNTNTLLNVISSRLDDQLGQSGFDFIVGGQTASSGPYTTVQVISTCRIAGLTATNSTVGTLTAFELPQTFTFNGPITRLTLNYGAVIMYKL